MINVNLASIVHFCNFNTELLSVLFQSIERTQNTHRSKPLLLLQDQMETLPSDHAHDLSTSAVEETEYNTINEPIRESLLRDARSIVRKLSVVLIPSKKNEFEKELKNCLFFYYIPDSALFLFYLSVPLLNYRGTLGTPTYQPCLCNVWLCVLF